MINNRDPLMVFIGKHYILICGFYFVVITGMGIIAAFRKKGFKEVTLTEEQYKKAIHYILIPLLFPTIFGMFAGAFGIIIYGVLYILDKHVYISNDTFIVLFIIWLCTSIIVSIKAYKSLYATYHNKI